MKRHWSGCLHGSIRAALRPNPPAVSSVVGNDRRLRRRSRDTRPFQMLPPTRAEGLFSAFVLGQFDSESCDADPPRASLALSYRLARDQPDRAVHSCARPMRALPPPAWPLRRPARRRWGVVGSGRTGLVRRSRSAIAAPARVRAAGADPHHAQARLSGDRAPQPRSDLQRTALAKSRRALPTLPHDPRCGRASPAPLVERVPPARARRPFLGPLSLTLGLPMSSSDRRSPRAEARTCGTSGTCSPRRAHGHPTLPRKSGTGSRGEDADAPSIRLIGGHDDRSLAGAQNDRDGTTVARR